MPQRSDIRNVAIIAHVDHGKTTLVDAMLRQSGVFSVHEAEGLTDLVMDSMDQERERGITILAKNAAVRYGEVKLNLVDTPGHADFGGEVERGLTMVDGVMLLVDASEGPLPADALRAPQGARGRASRWCSWSTRSTGPTRAPARWSTRSTSCSSTWTRTRSRSSSRSSTRTPGPGRASTEEGVEGSDLRPLFDLLVERIPAPEYDESHPLQARVTNLDADPYVGRLALCRVHHGDDPQGPAGGVDQARRGDCRGPRERALRDGGARAGGGRRGRPRRDHRAGRIPEITIGETIADPADPRPLPVIAIDEPALGVTIGINSSPLAGQSGSRLTARQVQDRLEQELVGNVAIRVVDTDRRDTWEVQGRGELQLAVLVETMRREGFELTVGKPQVVTREIDGKLHEPIERLSIDVPEDYLGVVTQMLALRKGRMEDMVNHGTGWVRLDFLVPTRGLIGFRTEFLTETRGSASSTRSSRATSRGRARSARAPPARSSPTAAGPPPRSRC